MFPRLDEDGRTLLARAADRSVGWLDRLEAAAREVLTRNPVHPQALDVLGSARMLRGDLAAAIQLLSRAVELYPRWTTALTHLGDALRASGRLSQAADHYRASIDVEPTFEALAGLGEVAMQEKQFDAATACFLRCVEIRPGDFAGWCNLSASLQGAGRLEEARQAIESALRRAPGHPITLQSRAHLSLLEGRLDEAIADCEQAIRGFAGGEGATRLADYESPDVYDRVPSTSPELSMCLFLLGVIRATRGDLLGALPLLEWRWGTPQQRVAWRAVPVPLWTGQSLAGRRLLVTFEQGLGDAIQFVRYAFELADEADEVLLALPPTLLAVLDGQHPRVRPASGKPDERYDFHVPVGSLPRMMLNRGSLRLGYLPYLRADVERVTRFRSTVPRDGRRLVGVAWKGSAGHPRDHERSSSLDDAAPLLRHPAISPVCLQLDVGDVGFPNPMPRVESLADTAAIIAALDAVVSVDTAVAHLAAAMGKPTVVLLNHPPDWRWTGDGERTAWYPSMRLVRKHRSEPWSAAWSRAAGMLA